ncbi:unnamed protein product, partial [Sphenostylis stenocarpa]
VGIANLFVCDLFLLSALSLSPVSTRTLTLALSAQHDCRVPSSRELRNSRDQPSSNLRVSRRLLA